MVSIVWTSLRVIYKMVSSSLNKSEGYIQDGKL